MALLQAHRMVAKGLVRQGQNARKRPTNFSWGRLEKEVQTSRKRPDRGLGFIGFGVQGLGFKVKARNKPVDRD